MKHLFKAALVREMWFDSFKERQDYLSRIKSEYVVLEASEEEEGCFYLALVTQYNGLPLSKFEVG